MHLNELSLLRLNVLRHTVAERVSHACISIQHHWDWEGLRKSHGENILLRCQTKKKRREKNNRTNSAGASVCADNSAVCWPLARKTSFRMVRSLRGGLCSRNLDLDSHLWAHLPTIIGQINQEPFVRETDSIFIAMSRFWTISLNFLSQKANHMQTLVIFSPN